MPRSSYSHPSATRGSTWSPGSAAAALAWPPGSRAGQDRLRHLRRLAHRPAAPGGGPAARGERCGSPLVALAGYRAMRRTRPSVPRHKVRSAAARPRDPPRRAKRRPGRPGPRAAGLPVPGRPLMAAGRPYGPNDPSLISSLETAVTGARRPGPAELAWNWRWEFGLLAVLAVPSGLIASAFGLLGLGVAAGAGLVAGAAALLLWPPARPWCVSRAWCLITPHRVRAGCANAWVQTRTGKLPFILATTPTADGEQVRLWLRRGPHRRGPARRQGRARGRLLGDGGARRPQSEPRAPGHPRSNTNPSSRTTAADS